ncbi:hypothetical protein CR513_00766, partial [Mucuna pruriens]
NTCWKLHGKPANWKSKSQHDNCANLAIVEENQELSINPNLVPFSKEQLEHLYKLFQSLKLSLNSFSSMVQKSNKKVKMVDDSLLAIAEIENIKLTPLITLHNVLRVPNLSCNMLSISKIISNHQCQELTTRRMIGSAKEKDGLYYFDDGPDLSKQCLNTCLDSTFASRDDDVIKKWFVTFIDDYTRLSWVYLMKEKYEVETIFINFYIMVQSQFQKNIHILQSDNGREYFNSVLVAQALLFSHQVSTYLWSEVVLTVAYFTNRMPNKVLNFDTPLYVLHKCFPTNSLSSSLPLKIFGYTALVHIHNHNEGKLEPQAKKCVFVGYAPK